MNHVSFENEADKQPYLNSASALLNPVSPGRVAAMVFGSILLNYPDDMFVSSCASFMADETLCRYMTSVAPEDFPLLQEYLGDILGNPSALDDLRSLYIDTFDRSRPGCPLYESEYGPARAMVKGQELGQLAHIYQTFGFKFGGDDAKDMVDHVAVELEFYSLMLLKLSLLQKEELDEGCAVVADGCTFFLENHLGRLIPAIRQRPALGLSMFYSQAFACIGKALEKECAFFGVEPKPLGWFDEQGPGDVLCGLSCGQQTS